MITSKERNKEKDINNNHRQTLSVPDPITSSYDMRPTIHAPKSPIAGKKNPEQIYSNEYNNNHQVNNNTFIANNTINSNFLTVGDKKKCMRLLVLGQDGIGKSAFVVRYLTRRFIGEYDPVMEGVFRRTVTLNNQEITVEIKDTARGIDWSKRANDLLWSHGLICMYSITNQSSFEDIKKLSTILTKQKKPILILGNKKDLLRDRWVDSCEGRKLASAVNATFYEVSVRDDYKDLERIIDKFIIDNCNELKYPASQLRMLSSRSSPEIRKGGNQPSIIETVESEVKTGKGRALWQKLRTNNDLKKKK